MSAATATVIRDGMEKIIPASELVIGDLVSLASGDMVPADLRLTQSANLKIAEASLTGESIASEKNATAVLLPDCPLGDRKTWLTLLQSSLMVEEAELSLKLGWTLKLVKLLA